MRRFARLAPFALSLALAACFERGGSHGEGGDRAAAPAIDARAADAAQSATARGVPRDYDPAATIALALEAEPAHLNPLLGGDAITNRVALGDVYEGLLCATGIDEPPEPCLADTVKVNDAGTVWTFTLRPGALWHDGRAVTVDDVAFTLGLLTGDDRAPSYLAPEVDDFVAFERAGERGFSIAFAGFRMGRRDLFVRLPILPAHVFGGASPATLGVSRHNRAPVGTGPLKLVAWERGESITLERNAAYWGRPSYAARVVYRVLSDRSRALRALADGDVDVVVQLPVDEAEAAAREHTGLTLFGYHTPAYLAAVYNLRRPALAAAETRRALGRLLDARGLSEALFGGRAAPITGPYPAGDPAVDPSIEPLVFDPAAAGAALSAHPELTVLVPAGSRTMGRIADIWASDARPYASLRTAEVPFADLLGRLRSGDFDVAMMAFTTSRDLDLYTRFHSSQAGEENYGALRDAELDLLLDAVRAEPRADRRGELGRAVHRRVHELQPYTFIVADTRLGLARADIGGLSIGGGVPAARSLWRERP